MTNSTITFVYLFGNRVFEAGIFRFVNMNMNLFGNSSTKGIFLLSSSIKSILVALIVLTKMLHIYIYIYIIKMLHIISYVIN
jgi:hypothetical protein